MNTTQEQQWSQEEQMGSMTAQDIDFSNLLDLDFSLPDSSVNDQQAQYAVQPPDSHYRDDMVGMGNVSTVHDFANNGWHMQMDVDPSSDMHSHNHSQVASPALNQQFDQHAWSNPNQQQQGMVDGQMGNMVYNQPQPVPPTPNSYEMHAMTDGANMARQRQVYMTHQFQHQLNLNQAKRDTFTPLVSPAVTPQESVFQPTHEYTVPGAYFSPLSSPAIQAQHAAQHVQHFSLGHGGTQPSTANHSTATSPISTDFDMAAFGADSAVSMPDRSRKSTRKSGAQRSIAQRAALRQSPLVKAQKRKSQALSTALASQDLEHLLREAQANLSQNAMSNGAASTDTSTGGSISPEPLTEALMGPPPRPGSASTHQSPTLYGQVPNHQQIRMKTTGGPATPASLMSIDNPSRPGSSTPLAASGHTHPLAIVDSALDDFALPPAAANNTVPSTPAIETFGTPSMAASRKTPKMNPMGSSSNGSSTSALISPAIPGMASPSLTMTPNTKARNSKKRASVSTSTSLVSPALRPKISPSIKPLLPEGSNLTDSQHAFLLASKSNYTHLLEGTSLPGVSYPDSLSSGLTSKRTSHKIAEQGRRNRINEALKEMQALLPSPALRGKTKSDKMDIEGEAADEDADEDPKKDTPKSKSATTAAAEAKAANSKAATVESAIEYIRALQDERRDMEQRMRDKDEEMESLRRQLREVGIKTSSSSPDDADV